MPMSDLSERARSELLEFTWSQWAQMGLSGATTRRDRWAADPEALLLFTLHVARHDPRLFDEVLDWLRENGKLISVQRLRNLTKDDVAGRRLTNAALAWAARNNPELRGWSSSEIAMEGDMEPLFVAGGDGLFVGREDDTFSIHGFSRPLVEPSHKSEPPDPGLPINLVFRLRLLFGLGSRSEVVRYLLTTRYPEAPAQVIAEATAFSKRNVNETLVALSDAGVVDARWRGNERVYQMDPGRWTSLLGTSRRDLPASMAWIPAFRALREIQAWLDEDAQFDRSPYLRASAARELLTRFGSDLRAANVEMPDERGARGEEYWEVFVRAVDAALRVLRRAG